MSVAQWVSTHAAGTPDKVAIHYADQSITYAALEQQITQMSALLTEVYGVQRGERIVWYGMNHPAMLVLLFAAARCGLILVPLNWRLALPELQVIVKDCVPRVLFHDQHFVEGVEALAEVSPDCVAVDIVQAEKTRLRLRSALGQRTEPLPERSRRVAPAYLLRDPLQVDGNDPLMIVYTSGTTGQPKGAVLSHNSFACNARMSQHMHDMSAADHVLSFLPMFHVGGFNIQLLPALSLGATVTLLEKFDPDVVMQKLDGTGVSLAIVVPTILQLLLKRADWDAADFSQLRALAIGSTDVPVPLIEAVHARDIPILQVYGCTETSPLAIYQRIENAFSSVGSIGRCGAECAVRLVDADGVEVAQGENGEIQVKGDNVLSAYWRNAGETESALTDGWFRTGDVARCDEQGFYWFADRLKHVIISGGENIYAAELERVIRGFPGLAEMTVVGQPDEKWGEVAVVVAVRADDVVVADNELEAQVLGAFNGKLARFKHPRKVIFVDALPRTALGKVQVDVVRELLK